MLRGLDNPELFKPSILGALATQIEVAQEFIPAIEPALGQNLQAIIMKDATVAEAAIRTLSTKKLGRASLALGDFRIQGSDFRLDSLLPEGRNRLGDRQGAGAGACR